MEYCVCGKKAKYVCRPCNVFVCNEHKTMHEKAKNKQHLFEKLGKKLRPEEIALIVENLTLKIKITMDCEKLILSETQKVLCKIKNMCKQALKDLKEKQETYLNILKNCQSVLLGEQMEEIKAQMKTAITVNQIYFESKEIENFYAADFLKENLLLPLEIQSSDEDIIGQADEYSQCLECIANGEENLLKLPCKCPICLSCLQESIIFRSCIRCHKTYTTADLEDISIYLGF